MEEREATAEKGPQMLIEAETSEQTSKLHVHLNKKFHPLTFAYRNMSLLYGASLVAQ